MSAKGDEDGKAEAEDENRNEEVAVGEDGSGALRFVHRVTSGSGFDDTVGSPQGLKPGSMPNR
jgi:hypothetical protein